MAYDAVEPFVRHPWLASALWTTLHALDHLLTIGASRLYRRGVDRVLQTSGSYELNPLFQTSVDRGAWVSRRFVVTLLAGAVLFLLLGRKVARDPTDAQCNVLALLLGGLLFTRLTLIGQHLHNIWIFRRVLTDPQALRGAIQQDRRMLVLVSRNRKLGMAAVLAVAAIVAPSAWLWGGAVAHFLMAMVEAVWFARSAREPARRPDHPPPAAEPAAVSTQESGRFPT